MLVAAGNVQHDRTLRVTTRCFVDHIVMRPSPMRLLLVHLPKHLVGRVQLEVQSSELVLADWLNQSTTSGYNRLGQMFCCFSTGGNLLVCFSSSKVLHLVLLDLLLYRIVLDQVLEVQVQTMV